MAFQNENANSHSVEKNKTDDLPRHVAIIMDGNGRWAKERFMPRIAGHRAGVEAVRKIIQFSAEKGIEALTVFAFSSENWRRPEKEVSLLMELFLNALQSEVKKLHENKIRLRVIGNRSAFPEKLQQQIEMSEKLTENNTGMVLNVAANYGGQWDIVQAVIELAGRVEAGQLEAANIDENLFASCLELRDLPEPDLFIRTGGEQRISNFLLWNLAYTELYFCDTLWPDFDSQAFDDALASYARRQRRFGRTGDQVKQVQGA